MYARRSTSPAHFLPAAIAFFIVPPIELMLLQQFTYTGLTAFVAFREEPVWPRRLVIVFAFVHAAQLIRFAFHDVAALRNIVPITLSVGILALALVRFAPPSVKYGKAPLPAGALESIRVQMDSLSEKMMHGDSNHRAYVFMISARDLARFGQLYLNNGVWNGRQLIPREWIARTFSGKPAMGDTEYGYLWWIYPNAEMLKDAGLPAGTVYAARGYRGHRLYVIPSLDVVIVHRVATGGVGLFAQMKRRFFGSGEVKGDELAKLMTMILRAHPAAKP